MTKPVAKFWSVEELKALQQEDESTRRERSYRRGFHQGVVAALNMVRAGRSRAEITAYERRIRVWRSKPFPQGESKIEYPEWPDGCPLGDI